MSSTDRETDKAVRRETTEEREAAWATLFEGPAPAQRLSERWADGLAYNPAAPDDVLHRLIGRTRYVLGRSLPASIVDAAVGHPDWKVRGFLAEVSPSLSTEQWTRLIVEDAGHRFPLTVIAVDRRVRLAETVCEQLARDPRGHVRAEATGLTDLPAHLLTALAEDPEAQVRASACSRAWPHLDSAARQKLLADPDSTVRASARLVHHRDHPLTREVFESEDLNDYALETCRLEPGLAAYLARYGEPAQRRALASNAHLDSDAIALLSRDSEDSVRFKVSVRADLSEAQRAHIPVAFDPGIHYHPLDWVLALQDDPAAMRRLASSSHPLVRRSVACARHLPPDVVDVLGRDKDRVVHLFLAESCDDTPADVLLGVWQWWTGSLSTPDRPQGHPNFPRRNLLRYADDPSPRMRRLALNDRDATAALVERFSRDASAEVRLRAATDPRLTAGSAVRLLDDPNESVRRAAATHPRLPARVLVRLLRNIETARIAARHPALPVEVMRHMTRPQPS